MYGFIMRNWVINIHVRITLISNEALFVSLYELTKLILPRIKLNNIRVLVVIFVICDITNEFILD